MLTGFAQEPAALDQDRDDAIEENEGALHALPSVSSEALTASPLRAAELHTQNAQDDVKLADVEVRHRGGQGACPGMLDGRMPVLGLPGIPVWLCRGDEQMSTNRKKQSKRSIRKNTRNEAK